MTPLALRLASRQVTGPDDSTAEHVVPLSQVRPPHGGTIVGFAPDLDPSHTRRLLDLGFTPGEAVSARHRAPAKDPVVYRVCGTDVALRRALAKGILVVPA